jgi:hypothetical protein
MMKRGLNPFKDVKQGVCHIVALPFTLKNILQQKNNYGNSDISPCKKYKLQENPFKETKIPQDIITPLPISSFNRRKILYFKNLHRKIDLLLFRGKNPLKLLYFITYLNTISLLLLLFAH